jgi:hypothetical protein
MANDYASAPWSFPDDDQTDQLLLAPAGHRVLRLTTTRPLRLTDATEQPARTP